METQNKQTVESGKRKKPNFVVKESKFSARVNKRWRYPRGKHSAVRQRHKGRPPLPTPGYGSPKSVKFLNKDGFKEILVRNEKDLLEIKDQNHIALFSSTMGVKKKITLLELAIEKKISVAKVKDIQEKIKELKNSFDARKKLKQKKVQQKSKKEDSRKKQAEEKKEAEEKAKKDQKEKTEETILEKKVGEQEDQKKIIEKTITKRQ